MSQATLFPESFCWGAATSCFQIEGALDADGRKPSIWDKFSNVPGKTFRGHGGEPGCDHYRRYREDVQLMKAMGLKAYRFSIAWPRVMPDGTGAVNAKGLEFYSNLVDELLAAGITPFVTLYHWDLPWALHLRGGWLNPDSPKWFADYVAAVVDKLGDRVENWFTLNEPQVFIGIGYGAGWLAPGLKLSLEENLLAGHHALLAHGRAAQVIRARAKRKPRVGWAPVAVSYYPETETPENIEAARLATLSVGEPGAHTPEEVHRMTWNSAWWMEPVYRGEYPQEAWKRLERFVPAIGPDDMKLISQPLDFFGANHYHGDPVVADGKGGWRKVDTATGNPTTTMKWDTTPRSIYWAAKFFNERYKLPVYFTENGTATTDFVAPNGEVHDGGRVEYVRNYLRELRRAVADGIDVAGYFYWSLMDNYEWAEGYAQRFGIVHVDYATQKRTVKDSGKFYSGVIASRGANL
ncbi:GH1 family beta-glucosidase [Nibricoccus sp. IMCC34717]|uniref:GH1 family beta-glucosidase n=1 Tax=Nibricoccus sp. IMCC34717 TaxID=3034021 RepID=UPI00384B40D9